MKQYLRSVYQPKGPISPVVLKWISPDLDPRNQEPRTLGGREGARLGSP
jgi:hypothetical protein